MRLLTAGTDTISVVYLVNIPTTGQELSLNDVTYARVVI